MQEFAGRRQVVAVGEDLAQVVAVVVIARHEIDRHLQLRQELPQHGVFLDVAGMHEVAGGENDVRPRPERIHMLDGIAQHVVGGNTAIGGDPRRTDVEIAQLDDDHAGPLDGQSPLTWAIFSL